MPLLTNAPLTPGRAEAGLRRDDGVAVRVGEAERAEVRISPWGPGHSQPQVAHDSTRVCGREKGGLTECTHFKLQEPEEEEVGVTGPWLSLSWGVSWHEGLGSERPQGTCTCLGWLPCKPRPYVEGLPTWGSSRIWGGSWLPLLQAASWVLLLFPLRRLSLQHPCPVPSPPDTQTRSGPVARYGYLNLRNLLSIFHASNNTV